MIRVIGVGDNVVDKYLDCRMMYPGGNSLNFAVYARKLGYESAYLGVFGDDAAAALIQKALDDFGVDHSRCRLEKGENGFSCVNIIDGERKFVVGNNGGVSREHPLVLTKEDLSYLQPFDLMHTSCYSFIEPELTKLHQLPGILSFDFSHMLDENYLKTVCPYVDFALLSCGGMKEKEIREKMHTVHRLGCRYVLASMGEEGTMFFDGQQFYFQPSQKTAVVDTLGAGDSLFTAFAARFVTHLKADGEVSPAQIQAALQKAVEFATETCQLNGAFGCGKAYD